jgi:formylglycine-generating enzyme required for sulfatase activity
VLKALLPKSAGDIKGNRRGADELLAASGYRKRPDDFKELMRILDAELRLITPADEEGESTRCAGTPASAPCLAGTEVDDAGIHANSATDSPSRMECKQGADAPRSPLSYQLTHDYLVPSLRDWLTRKQKESPRGRAELLLADRARVWNARRENRQLPSLGQWLRVRRLTTKKNWTPPERALMAQAARIHARRATVAVAACLLAAWGLTSAARWEMAATEFRRVTNVETPRLLPLDSRLAWCRNWADAMFRRGLERAKADGDQRLALHYSLALLPIDPGQVEYLRARLLHAEAAEVPVIVEALAPHGAQLRDELWAAARSTEPGPALRKLRAAAALARYDPRGDAWRDAAAQFAEQLVAIDPATLGVWQEALRPVAGELVAPLGAIFRAPATAELPRSLATSLLADYAQRDARLLAGLVVEADPVAFDKLFPVLRQHDAAVAELRTILEAGRAGPGKRGETRAEGVSPELEARAETLAAARRRATAAIALARLGERAAALDALRVDDDIEPLTQFVHRARQRGLTPAELLDAVDLIDAERREKSRGERQIADRALYGLLLTLGEFDLADLPDAKRDVFVDVLAGWYAGDASSAVHGATGWLLRRWGRDDLVNTVDETPVTYSPDREWFVMEFALAESYQPVTQGQHGADAGVPAQRVGSPTRFHITFVVFPPGEYTIGSPLDEPERHGDENLHTVKLTRPFALSDREITWTQFNPFDGTSHHNSCANKFGRTLMLDEPVVGVNWYEAVTYCRWLTRQAGMGEDDQCYANPKSLDVGLFPSDPEPNPVVPESVNEGAPRNWPLNLEGRGFRLPTNAEWEVACRCGFASAFSFGNDGKALEHYAWFIDNANEPKWPRRVGLRRPNARGLFDIHGNSYEWCHDRWGSTYANGEVDPLGPDTGSMRVCRGGVWAFNASCCRAAFRDGYQSADRLNLLGFRLALVPFN